VALLGQMAVGAQAGGFFIRPYFSMCEKVTDKSSQDSPV
jgi:hypothetical protein